MIAKEDSFARPAAWLTEVARIAVAAGAEVMAVYSGTFVVDTKEDQSPLTEADRRSHRLIEAQLAESERLPPLPILSEEGAQRTYDERRQWSRYWLVDPLDGTKEFVKRNDEFTVNIALVENGRPILGIVYAPALDVLYAGAEGVGAFRSEGLAAGGGLLTGQRGVREAAVPDGWRPIQASSARRGGPVRVVASRSHLNDATTAFVEGLAVTYGRCETVSRGSSLKLCLVAEGAADVYPRFAPTMEWDTAAGDGVARAARALVTTADGVTPLTYNKPDLLNPFFVVRSPWVTAPRSE